MLSGNDEITRLNSDVTTTMSELSSMYHNVIKNIFVPYNFMYHVNTITFIWPYGGRVNGAPQYPLYR